MPDEFRAVLVKGRSNYLSKRRLRVAQQKMMTLVPDHRAADELVQIGRWSRQTEDGSRSDLSFIPHPGVWDLVESDHGNCLGRKCPAIPGALQGPTGIHGSHILIMNRSVLQRSCDTPRWRDRFSAGLSGSSLTKPTQEDVAAVISACRWIGASNLLNRLYSTRGHRAWSSTAIHKPRIRLKRHGRQPSDSSNRYAAGWIARKNRPHEAARNRAGHSLGRVEEFSQIARANALSGEKIEMTSAAIDAKVARSHDAVAESKPEGQVYC